MRVCHGFDQRDGGRNGGERGFLVFELSHGTCDFGVVSVSDEEGVVSVFVESLHFAVHFGDERAGCVDGLHVAFLCL